MEEKIKNKIYNNMKAFAKNIKYERETRNMTPLKILNIQKMGKRVLLLAYI